MVNQEKRDEIERNEKLGNVKLHQMIDIEKDAQKGKRLILKKMPRKGKWLIWKKECDEKDENGLSNINLPI